MPTPGLLPATRASIVFAFAMIYVIWGSTYLAIAWTVQTIPPFFAIGTRFAFAGAVLYGFLRLRGIKSPPARRIWNAAQIGAVTLGFGTGMVAWAEQHIGSGFVSLIITAAPLWFVLLDWKMLKGGAPNRPVILGLVLGFIGIAVLVGPELSTGISDSNALAVVLVLAGSISWSVGSLRGKMIQMPENIFMSAAIQMAAGGVFVLSLSLLMDEPWLLDIGSISSRSAWSWAYLVVFGSFGAYSAYVWLLAHAPPKQISSYAFVNPVVAVFLGWWLAGEVVNARILVAVVIMVAAVALIVIFGANRALPLRRRVKLP